MTDETEVDRLFGELWGLLKKWRADGASPDVAMITLARGSLEMFYIAHQKNSGRFGDFDTVIKTLKMQIIKEESERN